MRGESKSKSTFSSCLWLRISFISFLFELARARASFSARAESSNAACFASFRGAPGGTVDAILFYFRLLIANKTRI